MSALAKLLPSRVPTPSGFVVRFAMMAVTLLLIAPAVLSDFRLSLLAKFLCFAIIAVGIGLAWGQGGLLVLGQGLFWILAKLHALFGNWGWAIIAATHERVGQVPALLLATGSVLVLAWLIPRFVERPLHHARALMLLLTEGFRNRHPDWPARTQSLMDRIEQVLRGAPPLDPQMPQLDAALDPARS